jgi:hypothetical protein
MGDGESEPPEGGLADCNSKPRLAEFTLGRECARVMGGAASDEPPDRDRTCGLEYGERLRWLDVGRGAGGLEK